MANPRPIYLYSRCQSANAHPGQTQQCEKEGVHPGNRIDRGYILLLEHHLGRTGGAAIESSKRRMEDRSSL